MIHWDDPNPVFFDFETQSAADIRKVGGRLYVEDPSTRILSAVFLIDGTFHVWVPGYAGPLNVAELWPTSLGAARPIVVDCDRLPSNVVLDAAYAKRTFVAHNCLGFDRFVWERFVRFEPPPWADTLPLARSGGFPGGLDRLSQAFGHAGKDSGKRFLRELTTAHYSNGEVVYPALVPGKLVAVLRYNVADVALLEDVWKKLDHVQAEADVIAAHDAINCRGVKLDTALAAKLKAVSSESVNRAAERIAEITGGELGPQNIRSIPQVNAWLDSKGVRIRDTNGKRTLRKDFVEQALANPWLLVDDDTPAAASVDIDPAVFEVLRLRAAALRITGAKADRMHARASEDGRARDLHGYHVAHTGRWSSSGVQVHNLPRPKKGVPVGALLGLHESNLWRDNGQGYELVKSQLPGGKLTVDDAVAALIRPCIVPEDGSVFVIVDYAKVECCGVAWIADENVLLAALAPGMDVYREMAARIFGKPPSDVDDYERQVGKVTVLGCGYSLGAEKFRIYAGLQGCDLASAGTTGEACVEAFRAAYPRIAGTYAGMIDGRPYRRGGVWDQLARAAMGAVSDGGVHRAGKCAFVKDGGTLLCVLPSGRQMRYRNARIEDCVPGYVRALGLPAKLKPTLIYDGDRGPTSLYGGKVTENVVQALCRDLLATALVRLEAEGYRVVLHVHDEIVVECAAGDAKTVLSRVATVMSDPPPWAVGFPVGVEGFAAPRYLKATPPGWPTTKSH